MSDGEMLYKFYHFSLHIRSLDVDYWDDLDDDTQAAWQEAADDFRRYLGL